ncbi:MAG: type I-B CRISPR-associated protein Cas7/Cst2/DevR [Candidatus Syntrophopropionicum ammoniitolerans]
MAFVTGLLLVDAQASALNNLGNIPGERYDNSTGVKLIRTKEGLYPYVSAQAYKYWLRTTLDQDPEWQAAPIYREKKIAYTDANPVRYWDDDLFGYMRAPSKRKSAQAERDADQSRAGETETTDTVTRAAPFRVGTLVSLAPARPTTDFGVMSRHEGDPVPHEHQFYRTTLKGLFSLDLQSAYTFWYKQKTGFRNLDDVRKKEAAELGLLHLEEEKAYRLPAEERVKRVTTLFRGMAKIDGEAQQTLHYTDVTPPLVIFAVTRGGNHIFNYVVGPGKLGLPELKIKALKEALHIYQDEILSDIYVGWVQGYLDQERGILEDFITTQENSRLQLGHPQEAFASLIKALQAPENTTWLE